MATKRTTSGKRRTLTPKATTIQRHKRAAQAVQMKIGGMSAEAIAAELGVTGPTITRDIQWYLEEVINKPARERVGEQLDVIQRARATTLEIREGLVDYLGAHLKYVTGEMEPSDPAVAADWTPPELDHNALGKLSTLNDSVIKLMDHEAKLQGLYAPTKVQVTAIDENFSETAARIIGKLERLRAIPPVVDSVTVTNADDHQDTPTADVVDAEVVETDDWVTG